MKSSESSTAAALEIKAGSITLPILKLLRSDSKNFSEQIRERIRRAPEFFRNAPVVIDLGELPANSAVLDFFELADSLRELDLVPIGVRGGTAIQHAAAQEARLVVLAESKAEPAPSSAVSAVSKATAAQPPRKGAAAPSKLIDQPVRSGQRIYAAGGDLIVAAPISAGAEVMADGHIHIYGTLRGRALAGVQGDANARIFCSDLQAELIAIGGHYKVSENLDESVRGKPVQIFLRDNALIVGDL